jgi:hypothetical protein
VEAGTNGEGSRGDEREAMSGKRIGRGWEPWWRKWRRRGGDRWKPGRCVCRGQESEETHEREREAEQEENAKGQSEGRGGRINGGGRHRLKIGKCNKTQQNAVGEWERERKAERERQGGGQGNGSGGASGDRSQT